MTEQDLTVKQVAERNKKQQIVRSILEKLQDWFGVAESREKYIHESGDQECFAAWIAGLPVGFLCLKETGPETIELAVMGVLKEYHRGGIGKALFEAAEAYAVQQGYAFMQVKTVQMGCYDDYDETNRFYRALGFRELEVIPAIWGPENPCQIYVLPLKERPSVQTVISARRSYRGRFIPAPVPREDLRKIMQAGLDAPSGCNKQTTSVIAVDDPVLLGKLRAVIQPPVAETAPALICVLTRRINAYRDRCFAVQDYSAAIENMLLMISALGYQSCWYEGHITDEDRIGAKMAAILDVPEEYELVCMLPVGIAAEKPGTPKKKEFCERAWFNGFQKQDDQR